MKKYVYAELILLINTFKGFDLFTVIREPCSDYGTHMLHIGGNGVEKCLRKCYGLRLCVEGCLRDSCHCPIPGWRGIFCDQRCSQGYYGEDCANRCSCENGAECHHVNGKCKCKGGFKGERCSERCPPGTWGPNCFNECLCKNGAECLPDKGCDCTNGWFGVECSVPCKNGFFGKMCSEKCNCENGAECNHIDGSCFCLDGFKGENCSEPCPPGTWGANCTDQCQCENGAKCIPETGYCDCSDGFKGDFCEIPCDNSTYGYFCSKNCSCENGADCNITDGSCTCMPGFIGTSCNETCRKNTWGIDCENQCNCQNEADCHIVTGECLCKPGYVGNFCENKCTPEFHGVDCKNMCNCSREQTCDHVTGECQTYLTYDTKFNGSDCDPRNDVECLFIDINNKEERAVWKNSSYSNNAVNESSLPYVFTALGLSLFSSFMVLGIWYCIKKRPSRLSSSGTIQPFSKLVEDDSFTGENNENSESCQINIDEKEIQHGKGTNTTKFSNPVFEELEDTLFDKDISIPNEQFYQAERTII